MSDSMGGGAGGDGGDFPKASIGNYKGVMLCNRPNEFGQQRRAERSGVEPFNSRVDPKVPIGWNPTLKLNPQVNKKKRDPNSILVKHRRFLKELEDKKNQEREEGMLADQLQQLKVKQFKDQAQNQRDKIKVLKEEEPDRLTQQSLKKVESQASVASAANPKSQKAKKSAAKPAWATTAKQQEEEKEADIDNLLEFAYELDYEKYMEDFEVRQALAVIKDRVTEIKQEPDWKQKMAEEWNQANDDERRQQQDDSRSQATQKTNASRMSTQSYSKRMAEAKEKAEKAEWDGISMNSEARQKKAEDRMASKIATEVLSNNPKLRGVHSKESIKKILEKEAIRQMQQEGSYPAPLIVRNNEKQQVDRADPSNLPYLHKNPAV